MNYSPMISFFTHFNILIISAPFLIFSQVCESKTLNNILTLWLDLLSSCDYLFAFLICRPCQENISGLIFARSFLCTYHQKPVKNPLLAAAATNWTNAKVDGGFLPTLFLLYTQKNPACEQSLCLPMGFPATVTFGIWTPQQSMFVSFHL
jgi:hypothetical protein